MGHFSRELEFALNSANSIRHLHAQSSCLRMSYVKLSFISFCRNETNYAYFECITVQNYLFKSWNFATMLHKVQVLAKPATSSVLPDQIFASLPTRAAAIPQEPPENAPYFLPHLKHHSRNLLLASTWQ